jgi:hypothetical protein
MLRETAHNAPDWCDVAAEVEIEAVIEAALMALAELAKSRMILAHTTFGALSDEMSLIGPKRRRPRCSIL